MGNWQDLISRPGFLIRRLHQIHVALFLEECGAEGITPVQYSVLSALKQLGSAEQGAIGQAVAIDKANTADVVGRLEKRGALKRAVSPTDHRARIVTLTKAGLALLARLEAGAIRAHQRTIDILPPAERKQFVRSMARLVTAKSDVGRVKLRLS